MLKLKTFWTSIVFLVIGGGLAIYQMLQPGIDAQGFVNDSMAIPLSILALAIGVIFLGVSIGLIMKNKPQAK